MLGAARALQGEVALAADQMEPLFEATFAYGFFGMYPEVMMTDTLAGCNRNEEALALVRRLLEGSTTPEVGVFVPELWRLRAKLVLRQSASSLDEAKRYLETSLRMAVLQDAPIYRLRAGIDLTKLLAENGQFEEAKSAIDRVGVQPLDEWTGKEVAVVTELRSELGVHTS